MKKTILDQTKRMSNRSLVFIRLPRTLKNPGIFFDLREITLEIWSAYRLEVWVPYKTLFGNTANHELINIMVVPLCVIVPLKPSSLGWVVSGGVLNTLS